jgi:hypothetical protein
VSVFDLDRPRFRTPLGTRSPLVHRPRSRTLPARLIAIGSAYPGRDE